MNEQIRHVKAQRRAGSKTSEAEETLSVEGPLLVRINGEAFTTTMRTPGDDLDLVRGLLLSEDIVPDAASAAALDGKLREIVDPISGATRAVEVELPPGTIALDDIAGRRSMLSTSSCGICGVREITDLEDDKSAAIQSEGRLDLDLIPSMMERMRAAQTNFRATGGCHAAAMFTLAGEMLCAFEDIGRHNAVDKAVGRLIARRELDRAAALLVSGRLSYEIVYKAWRAKIPFVLSVSAPSSLAVLTAERAGITLVAFCRDDRATVYANPQRVKQFVTR